MYCNEGRTTQPGVLNWLFPGLVTLVLIGIGGWLHLGYSYDIGQLAFFKNAYDEDTYALFTEILDDIRLDRLLSALLLQSARDWFGGYDLAFILADALLPAMAFLSCWYLAGRLYQGAEVRTFWALLILLSPDLFSLGSAASSTADLISLSTFKALFGEMGQILVPPIETSYLNIFRTFEPQLAYVVGFLFVGILLKIFVESADTPRTLDLVLLGLVQVFVLMTYSLVSYPLIAVEAYAAIIMFITGTRKAALVLVSYLMFSVLCIGVSSSSVLNGIDLVFHNRIPSFGTSTFGSIGICFVVFTVLAIRRFADRLLWLALGFSGLPLVLMNQQLITGLMVSTKDWERYVNHPLLFIGAAILCSQLPFPKGRHAWPKAKFFRAAMILLTSGMLIFAINGTGRTRENWVSINETSLAMTRAVKAVSERVSDASILVLDDVSLAPLIAVRSKGALEFLVDYTDVFINPIPSSSAADYKILDSGFDLFEYWRLASATPEFVEQLLRSEAQSRGGFFSGFFFNLCDYWYPCSDNRAVNSELIQSLIGMVVEAYEGYLSGQPTGSAKRYLLVTTDPTRGAFERHFAPNPIATEQAGNVTAYVFRLGSE
jgi:hypothetical protein